MSIDTLQHCKILGHEEVVDRRSAGSALHAALDHSARCHAARGPWRQEWRWTRWRCTLDAVQACTRHRPVVEFRFGAPRRRGFTHKIDVNAIRVTQ